MVGAVARFDLVEGEPVTATKLVQPGDQSFMSAMLTPGMRAASIEISPETAAGGFILPNDRIDVTVTREIEGGNANAGGMANIRSDMILQNVRVLAIDGVYAPPAKRRAGRRADRHARHARTVATGHLAAQHREEGGRTLLLAALHR